jgi:hypothetical protein
MYDHHLSWRNNGKTYPQKKGSIFGKLLFSLLSLNLKLEESKIFAKYSLHPCPLNF